jgi:putative ABC transport system substrate-binding protein
MKAPRRGLMIILTIAVLTVPFVARDQPTGRVHRIGVLDAGSSAASSGRVESLRSSLRELGLVEGILPMLRAPRASALLVAIDPFYFSSRRQIVEAIGRHGLPAIHGVREFVADGGLASFGPSLDDASRQAALCVDRILKGAKPADLPVEQPTRFALVIGTRTAKALGLTTPPAVLARADEIIE